LVDINHRVGVVEREVARAAVCGVAAIDDDIRCAVTFDYCGDSGVAVGIVRRNRNGFGRRGFDRERVGGT